MQGARLSQLEGVGPSPTTSPPKIVSRRSSEVSSTPPLPSRTIPPPVKNSNVTNRLLTHAWPANQHPALGQSQRHHTWSCLSLSWKPRSPAFGLLYIGQQSKSLPTSLVPNHAHGLLREPFTIWPTRAASLTCSCTTSLRHLPFFRTSAPSSLPTSRTMSGLVRYSMKMSPNRPIRPTWPNKLPLCCQLGDHEFHLFLQVALTYSLDKTSVRDGGPPLPANHTCQPDGHDYFLLLTGRRSSLSNFSLIHRPMA